MAARKSLIFLNSVLPPSRSHDELVKRKLKPGKYIFTPTGIINILGIMCLVAAIAFFLASSACEDEDDWRRYIFLIMNLITILVTITIYLVFSTGRTVKHPWFWVKTGIICNIIFPTLTIIISIVSTTACINNSTLQKLPQPFGIAGGVILIVSSAALFLLYRYKEEEQERPQPVVVEDSQRKKSVHV